MLCDFFSFSDFVRLAALACVSGAWQYGYSTISPRVCRSSRRAERSGRHSSPFSNMVSGCNLRQRQFSLIFHRITNFYQGRVVILLLLLFHRFGNHECVKALIDYSASLHVLNTFGLDAHTNVLTRSPLAQKKKYPSGLRKAVALIAAHAALPQEPEPSTAALSLQPPPSASAPPEPALRALPEEEPAPSSRRSTGSSDEFEDAIDPEDDEEENNGETLNVSSLAVPIDVLVALGRRAPDIEASGLLSEDLGALSIGP